MAFATDSEVIDAMVFVETGFGQIRGQLLASLALGERTLYKRRRLGLKGLKIPAYIQSIYVLYTVELSTGTAAGSLRQHSSSERDISKSSRCSWGLFT